MVKNLPNISCAHLRTVKQATVGKNTTQTIKTKERRDAKNIKQIPWCPCWESSFLVVSGKTRTQIATVASIFHLTEILGTRKCESNMAGARAACPFARLSSCKHFTFRNLIPGVKKFEVVCRRHASNNSSFSNDVFSYNYLPAPFHDRHRPRLLSLVAPRNVHNFSLLWKRSLFRYCCR